MLAYNNILSIYDRVLLVNMPLFQERFGIRDLDGFSIGWYRERDR